MELGHSKAREGGGAPLTWRCQCICHALRELRLEPAPRRVMACRCSDALMQEQRGGLAEPRSG